MPVNLVAPDPAGLHPVAGLELGTARAGIRKAGRRDLLIIRLAAGAVGVGARSIATLTRTPSPTSAPSTRRTSA